MMQTDPAHTTGETAARQRRSRVLRAMLLPAAIAITAIFLAKRMLGGDVATNPTLAIIATAVIAIFTVAGSIWHHRVIDEHDERAILWANTVGFYTLIVLLFGASLLESSGLIARQSPALLIVAATLPTLGTYVWLKFR
jgi:hypothetical protein